jgi:hypothetical protein
MAQAPSFDVTAAHRRFSVDCFHQAWALIEKPDRTPEEDEAMLRLGQASLWHWTQREDCTEANRSIGTWQVSRIHAILGRAGEARRYGRLCLEQSRGASPFLRGYAHEALARAERLAGNDALAEQHLAEAAKLAAEVEDVEDRELLLGDLAGLGASA